MSAWMKRTEAAVLVPVYRDGLGQVHIVLVVRTPGDPHGGQVAFPGGKRSQNDQSLRDTAIREAQEEIGLEPASVRILEELPRIDTMTTGFIVTPFLATIERPVRWRPSEREVAEVLDVLVSDFAQTGAREEEVRTFPEFSNPLVVPFYRVGPHKLWGATFRILEPLVGGLMAQRWDI